MGITMNRATLTIKSDGQTYDVSKNILVPVKMANLLDEQLDECSVSLKNCTVQVFQPNSYAHLQIIQELEVPMTMDMVGTLLRASDYQWDTDNTLGVDNKYTWRGNYKDTAVWDGETKLLTITLDRDLIVASDNAIEKPVGSFKYDHELYLIEFTKIAEGFIGESLTFTNSREANYSSLSTFLSFYTVDFLSEGHGSYTKIQVDPLQNNPNFRIQGEYLNKTDFYLFQITNEDYLDDNTSSPSLAKNAIQAIKLEYPTLTISEDVLDSWGQDAYGNASQNWTYYNTFGKNNPFQRIRVVNKGTGQEVALYELYFEGTTQQTVNDETRTIPLVNSYERDVTGKIRTYQDAAYSFNYSLAGYRYSFGKIFLYGLMLDTHYDVEYTFFSRDALYGGAPVKIKATYTVYLKSAELSKPSERKWTISNVIERLCDVIEPRKPTEQNRFNLNTNQKNEYKETISPEFTFTQMNFREQLQQVGGFIHAEPRIDSTGTIYFDKYGEQTRSHIQSMPYIAAGFKTDINEFCTQIDTNAENLVNRLDYAQGVIYEPFERGYITARTESSSAQIADDDTTFIPTRLPIYEIIRVYATYNNTRVDLSSYIFEEADYNGLLSSTSDDNYPYTKGYALNYTQGQQNIKGLFFRLPKGGQVKTTKYAITNILGLFMSNPPEDLEDVMNIGFQVEYVPMYNTRIKTSKQTPVIGIPRTKIYNQGENIIETRYFSQHLQGVAERLGNIEKNYTYMLAFGSDIPKVGLKFDKNYYISAVSTEFLPDGIKCTVGLSKNFNRISNYVGISSNKRMWEVSEKQSVQRETVLQDFLVVSFFSPITNIGMWAGSHFNISNFFAKTSNEFNTPVSHMEFSTYSKKGTSDLIADQISVSVVSSAFGNSLALSSELFDNYSAGQVIDKIDKAFYANYVQYNNYYGNFYLFGCTLSKIKGYDWSVTNGREYPKNNVPSNREIVGECHNELVYRKDNREIMQLNFELTAVTGRGDGDRNGINYKDTDLIIGTGLMKNSSLVTTNVKAANLWLLRNEISMFENPLDIQNNLVDRINWDYDGIYSLSINRTSYTYGEDYKSWAFFTAFEKQTLSGVDESGNKIEQTVYTGGELMLGANTPLPPELNFAVTRRTPQDEF